MAERQVRIVITAADQTAKAFSSIKGRFTRLSTSLAGWGSKLTWRLTAPIIGLGTAAAKAAIDYESAFVGVIKTTEGLGDSIRDLTPLGEELYDFFIDLSKAIPVSAVELAGIGEIAGQLGVRAEDIDDFTLAIAAIGSATNLSYSEAATGFARFINIMGLTMDEVDEMGSAIVDLGNNFAVTEQEILEMALRLGGVAKIVGISAPEVLGWATVIKTAGLTTELGASALQRTWMLINKAVSEGEEGLEGFASVAGLSSDAFAKMWEQDPTGATQLFVDGLGKISDTGGDAIGVLDALGIKNVRIVRTLLSLASAEIKAKDTIGLANDAWLDNIAMMTEAERRWSSTASQITIAWNMLKAVGIQLGEILAPIIRDFLEKYIMPLIEWFGNLDLTTQKWILGILAVVAAIGPAMLILSGLAAVLGLIASPIGLIVLGIAALVAAFIASQGGIEPTIEMLRGLWDMFANWLAPVITDLQALWDFVWPHIRNVVETVLNAVVPFVKRIVKDMSEFFTAKMEVIRAWVHENWPLIGGTIIKVVNLVQALFEKAWPIIEAILTGAWENMKLVISTALDIVLGLIKTVMLAIQGDWEGVWDEIYGVLESVWDMIWGIIKNTLNTILGFFGTSLEDLWLVTRRWFFGITEVIGSKLRDAWNATVMWFNRIFASAATRMTELWEKIRSVALDIYEAITRPFKDAKEFLSKLHIPVPHVKVSWKAGPLGINIPKFSIKWYGQGLDGIFNTPTLIGVGERGAERVQVTPLGRRGAEAETEGRPTYEVNVYAPTGNAQDTVARMLDALKMLEMGTVPA